MAYLPETELEKQQKGAGATSENVVGAESGTIGSGSPSPTGPATASGAANAPSRSGFTNLVKYVQANKGNDAQLGGAVNRVVGNSAGAATQAATNFQTTGQQAVDKGTVKDQGIVAAVKKAPQTVNKDQFTTQYNATYGGPTEYSAVGGYDDALTTSSKATQQVQAATGDLSARTSVLRDAYQNPGYRRGEQNFDSFLLGAGEQGKAAIQGIGQQYGDIGKGLDTARDAVTSAIDAGKATTDKTRADTRAAYDAARKGATDTLSTLQTTIGAEGTNNAAAYTKLVTDIGSKNAKVRAAAYKQAGIDPETGEWLRSKGYDAAKIIQATKARSLGDAAAAQDVQRYQSLLGLLGDQSAFDFTKAGGTSAAYTTRQDQINAAKGARADEIALQEQLTKAQASRANEYGAIRGGLNSFNIDERNAALAKLGISPEDGAYLYANDIDPLQYVTQGRKLSYGDVANAKTAKQYQALLKTLGVSGLDLSTQGAAGKAYSFDKARFDAAMEPHRIEQQQAAEAAAQAAAAEAAAAEERARNLAQAKQDLEDGKITGYVDEDGNVVTG